MQTDPSGIPGSYDSLKQRKFAFAYLPDSGEDQLVRVFTEADDPCTYLAGYILAPTWAGVTPTGQTPATYAGFALRFFRELLARYRRGEMSPGSHHDFGRRHFTLLSAQEMADISTLDLSLVRRPSWWQEGPLC